MSKFRKKKPVEIEAVQMPTSSDQPAVREVAKWMVDHGYDEGAFDPAIHDSMFDMRGVLLPCYGANFLEIETLEGDMTASLGDWIIRGVQGEFYPCKPNIFAETYEPVTQDGPPMTAPEPVVLTDGEREALARAARSTNLVVSDLQMLAVNAAAEQIKADTLAAERATPGGSHR